MKSMKIRKALILSLILMGLVLPGLSGCGKEATRDNPISDLFSHETGGKEADREEESNAKDLTPAERYGKKYEKLQKGIYYYYDRLDHEQASRYRTILQGLMDMSETIQVDSTYKETDSLFTQVMYDHPELFWVDMSYSYMDMDSYVKLLPHYNCTRNKRIKKQEKVDQAAQKALKKINKGSNDYEKVKKTFEYLVKKTDYVTGAQDNQNLYSSLVLHKTVCSGYAKATQYLLQKAGIKTVYVVGTVKEESHAWNIVRCGKKYYQVDTTFGDPSYAGWGENDKKVMPDKLKIHYAYLCCNDKVILKKRTMNDQENLPKCTAVKYNYFKQEGLYFKEYSSKVSNSMISSIKKGKKYWQGQFASKEAYKAAKKKVKNGLYGNLAVEITNKSLFSYYTFNDDVKVIQVWFRYQ